MLRDFWPSKHEPGMKTLLRDLFRFSRKDLVEFIICLVLAGIFVLLSSGKAFAQGNVGINNPTPHAKSLLDLTSSDKGLLTPRMTAAQRTAMFPVPDASARGMLVYQTDGAQGFCYYDGAAWLMLQSGAAGWGLSGNAGTSAATHFIGTTDNQGLSIRTNGTERMHITTSGEVGMGTPAPAYGLHLLRDTPGSAPLGIQSLSNNGVSGVRFHGAAGTLHGVTGWANTTNAYTPNTLVHGTLSSMPATFITNATERVRIDAAGNVGIGTSAPVYTLDLQPTSATSAMRIRNLGPTGFSGTFVDDDAGLHRLVLGMTNTGSTLPGVAWLGSSTVTPLVLATQSMERARLLATGEFGIGTTAPTYGLHVVRDAVGTAPFAIRNLNNAGVSGTHYFSAGGTLAGVSGWSNGGNAFAPSSLVHGTLTNQPLTFLSNSVERMRIDPAGNVGIGTTAPTSALEVNGYTKLGSNAPSVRMLKLTGVTGATEGGFVDVPHGLTASKILSVELLIEYTPGAWVTESYLVTAEYQANCVISATNIRVANHATNSGNILSKPLKILVTYEQ